MSTLRPSDNPVDFEKKNNIITIYAVSSGLCREATQREVLRRRSTTQADSLEKSQFVVKLAWENNLLNSTPPLVSLQKDGETSFAVFFPLPSCCVSSLMYKEDNLWFPRSFSSQLSNPESALWCGCTWTHESLRNVSTLKTHLLFLTGLRTLGNIRFEDEDSLHGRR